MTRGSIKGVTKAVRRFGSQIRETVMERGALWKHNRN